MDGSIQDQDNWVKEYLEKAIPIRIVFGQDKMIDCIGVIKSKGFKVVTARWPQKNYQSPETVKIFHRTEINKNLYGIDAGIHTKDGKIIKNNAPTELNLTDK